MRRKTFRLAMEAASNIAFRSTFVKYDGTYQTEGHNNLHSSVNTRRAAKISDHYESLTFSTKAFKCQVSVVAKVVMNENVLCRKFLLSNKNVHLIGCPVHPSKVKMPQTICKLLYTIQPLLSNEFLHREVFITVFSEALSQRSLT